jgi:hypothetical protein
MNKTDTLVNALRIHFQATSKDGNVVDSLVLAYVRGILGELEKSDKSLASSLEYHIQSYNK